MMSVFISYILKSHFYPLSSVFLPSPSGLINFHGFRPSSTFLVIFHSELSWLSRYLSVFSVFSPLRISALNHITMLCVSYCNEILQWTSYIFRSTHEVLLLLCDCVTHTRTHRHLHTSVCDIFTLYSHFKTFKKNTFSLNPFKNIPFVLVNCV